MGFKEDVQGILGEDEFKVLKTTYAACEGAMEYALGSREIPWLDAGDTRRLMKKVMLVLERVEREL